MTDYDIELIIMNKSKGITQDSKVKEKEKLLLPVEISNFDIR